MRDCWESAILPLILQVSSIVYQIPFSEYEFVHLFFKDYVFKKLPLILQVSSIANFQSMNLFIYFATILSFML